MSISIGGISLDSAFSNMSYEYFTTSNGEIIGGAKILNVTGTVSVESGPGSGRTVMGQLAAIRDLGRSAGCVTVSIPGQFSGQAKITNVTIDQGPDPTWVNQGSYSIELRTKLDSIPPNSIGITVDDYVEQFSKTETIELGEDHHGFIFLSDRSLSKAYVKFSCQISITCRPLCDSTSPQSIMLDLLRRFAVSIPTHPMLDRYKSWKPYAQSRSLEISANDASWSTDVILLPPNISAGAFVDLDFEHDHSYQDNQASKKITGSIVGLSPISWGDLIDLSSTASSSKLAQAESVFNLIRGRYSSLNSWSRGGQTLFLKEQPNCPPSNSGSGGSSIGICKNDDDEDSDEKIAGAVEPAISTVSRSRTEGTINFVFEWNTPASDDGGCADSDGYKREITVDITEPQSQIVEHIIPSYGTLIQDLNACSAKRISFTSAASSTDNICISAPPTGVNEKLDETIAKYLTEGTWLLISHTKQTSNQSLTITKEYIQKC